MVYYTLGGNFPFDDPENDEEMIAKKIVFQNINYNNNHWKSKSSYVVDFINQCLVKDMDQRSSIKTLINHSWFEHCNIDTYKN